MPALASIFKGVKTPNAYAQLTWDDLKNMVANPQQLPSRYTGKIEENGGQEETKFHLPCISATNCTKKTKQAVLDHNSMSYLRVDCDENEHTIQSLTQQLVNVGINTFVIYTSFSHSPEYKKLKCLIPLSEPVTSETWLNLQMRLTESFDTDDCENRINQINYVPATYPGHVYEHYTHEAGQHNFDLLPALKPKPVMQKRAPLKYEGDSLIEEYNSRFDWDFELSANGYVKKGKKWLSPSASSSIPGGTVFKGDDGKMLFHTHHSSDPISAMGCVDGFGFTCLMENKTPAELALSLSQGELKEWNKEKQKAFAEAKESESNISDADIAKFSAMFTQKAVIKDKENTFFGTIKAPIDGCYNLSEENEVIRDVMENSQFESDEPEDLSDETPDDIFPTPVDHNIDLHTAPGIVGECINYINSMGRKPRRKLAVGAALTAVGMVGSLSHKDTGENNGATSNLFTFNVAGSASGKEAVLQATSEIVRQSGFRNCTFGKIKSEQELYRNLINSQANLYNIDEIGEVLGKITGSTETYMTGIIGTLMSLYSKASGSVELGGDEIGELKKAIKKKLASIETDLKENEIDEVMGNAEKEKLKLFLEQLETSGLVNPFLAISGCTTPEKFLKIATRENVLSGFIGRTLIFKEEKNAPRRHRNYNPDREFPLHLAHELKKIRCGGNQQLIETGRNQNYGDKVAVTTTKEAQAWLNSLSYNLETEAIEHDKTTGMEALKNREYELVAKVSYILAIGDGKVRTLDHVKWAQRLASIDFEQKVKLVKGNTMSSEEVSGPDRLMDLTDAITDLLDKQGAITQNRIVNRIAALDVDTSTKLLTVMIQNNIVEAIEPARKGAKVKYQLKK